MPIQKQYVKAFFPLFGCDVKIDHAHQDDQGQWIFTVSNEENRLGNHLCREHELTNFSR